MSKDHQARRAGRVLRYALGGVLLAAAVACGDSDTSTTEPIQTTRTYNQVQRLGNPLLSEVFLTKRDHPFHSAIGPAEKNPWPSGPRWTIAAANRSAAPTGGGRSRRGASAPAMPHIRQPLAREPPQFGRPPAARWR